MRSTPLTLAAAIALAVLGPAYAQDTTTDAQGGATAGDSASPDAMRAAADVCGRPLGCKRYLRLDRACDQVRSCVRPQRCGRSYAAGPYGDMQVGTSSLTRARWRAVRNDGSPDPVS